MTNSWLIIERFENWEVDEAHKFSFFGLSDRYRNVAGEISARDVVYTYVSSGRSSFADIRVVQETGLKKLKTQSYDLPFAFCFTTAPLLVLPRANWLSIHDVASELELTRGKKDYRPLFRTSIRKLSEHDASILRMRLELASKKA